MVSRGPLSAAGSPGPLERKTPSGSRARTSAAVVPAGTTVTRPSAASRRTMVALTPKSNATIRSGPSPYVDVVVAVTPETRSRPSVVGAAAAAARSSASGAVPKAQGMAPTRRRWRVSRRVSTPVMAAKPWRTRKASSPSVDLQFEGTAVRSRTTTPSQRGRGASSSSPLVP